MEVVLGFLMWWALFWDKNARFENFWWGGWDGVWGVMEMSCVRGRVMVVVVGDEEMKGMRRERVERERKKMGRGVGVAIALV